VFAAIPYFALGVYNLHVPGLGNLPIDPWFTLVCVGFVVGLEVSRYRGIKLGLDVRDIVDGAVFTVLMGFFVGHVFTVVAYFPERLKTEGIWSILRVWEGFSSIGGFLGAVLGATLFYKVIRKRDPWRHADVIMYGFPFGWIFGRMGCSVVHDHVGRSTHFFLGMYFPAHTLRLLDGSWAPAGVRYELGILEMLYTIGIAALFWWLGRKDRPPGFFLAMWALVYSPARFALDFLRNTDLYFHDDRYFGLTPAHYASLFMFVAGIWLWSTLDFEHFKPWPLDGKPNQADRAAAEPPGAPLDAEAADG